MQIWLTPKDKWGERFSTKMNWTNSWPICPQMIKVTANEIFHKKEKVKHEWSTASDKP